MGMFLPLLFVAVAACSCCVCYNTVPAVREELLGMQATAFIRDHKKLHDDHADVTADYEHGDAQPHCHRSVKRTL